MCDCLSGRGLIECLQTFGRVCFSLCSKYFDGAFGLVFVSSDFEVGTNVSCIESIVSRHPGFIFRLTLLIKPVSNVCPFVRRYVHVRCTCVRPSLSTKSLFDFS